MTASAAPARGRLMAAVALSLAIVGAAPAAGVARSQLQAALGPRFSAVITLVVAAVVSAAVGRGLAAARPFTAARLGAIAAAVAIAAGWVTASGSADAAIRAVELVHFVEYGVITLAFDRAWRDRPPAVGLTLAGLAAFVAGVVEEAWQWFLPARVGELKDVALNGVAIGCALLVAWAVTSRRREVVPAAPSWTPVWRMLALVVVAVAAFIHLVHLGVVVHDGPRAFDSRFTAAELDAAAAARTRAWTAAPPLIRPDRLSREDQYASEGLQHVQTRNRAWADGDAATAWHENAILERWFAPVLDAPSYVSKTGHRWAAEQRAEAGTRAGGAVSAPFESGAFPYPLWQVSPGALWSGALVVATMCLAAAARARAVTPAVSS